MDKQEILKKYICTTPFVYMEAHKNGVFSCCPSWLPNKISSLEDIETAWDSKELKKIQNSIIEGEYSFCSKTECPYLSYLIKTKNVPQGFVPKDSFNLNDYKNGPSHINFAFDRSCNLSCPSCRNSIIMADGKEIDFIDKQINKICNVYGKNLTMFYLSGSADPFASKSIRKFLLTFDKNKFPKLKNIHLHTNGLLLNEKTYNELSHIHDLIKTLEISIDASKKETYEELRRGGKWEQLMENLDFISSCKSIKNIRTSFVVQDTNFREMEDFYNLMMNKFKNNVDVYFNKITNWGTFSEKEFELKQIWNEKHKNFNNFLEEVKKINGKYRCIHNMHDIINKFIPKQYVNII